MWSSPERYRPKILTKPTRWTIGTILTKLTLKKMANKITPSLLTIGREIEILGEYTGKDLALQDLYHHRTKTIEDFLKSWTALYLQNLSPTKKWLEKNPYKIKEGMILFIKDENKMKDLWKKGVVTKVIRSENDQLPRTIQLRTKTSD